MTDHHLAPQQLSADQSEQDLWENLKQFTKARIALGRAGASLPTKAWLDFQAAHAQAKDAVWASLDEAALLTALQTRQLPIVQVHSQNVDKADYLKRPDLGRCLSVASRTSLLQWQQQDCAEPIDVVVVIADGLSATAVQQHAIPMLDTLLQACKAQHWYVGPIVLAQGARVALGDEIAQILNAKMLVVMIGERPGLSSPDSMGIYYTWKAQVGTQDAARNCISNIHAAGCSVEDASRILIGLMRASERLQQSGIALKDQSDPTAARYLKHAE